MLLSNAQPNRNPKSEGNGETENTNDKRLMAAGGTLTATSTLSFGFYSNYLYQSSLQPHGYGLCSALHAEF